MEKREMSKHAPKFAKKDDANKVVFFRTLYAITVGAANECVYFVKMNLRYFAGLANVLLPYVMYLLGQFRYIEGGQYGYGWELLIPVVTVVVVYYIREFANHSNVGSRVPVPKKRFTSVDPSGEVTVDKARLQEMMLYVADLEDFLSRKGLL